MADPYAEGFVLSEKDRDEAVRRNRNKDGYLCVGGIGAHGECYSHGPPCPYCLATHQGRRMMSDMPTMDAVYRFMKSNPKTSMEMLGEITTTPADACSDARLRELWKEHGGGFNKARLQFFIERDLLPDLLRKIIASAVAASVSS